MIENKWMYSFNNDRHFVHIWDTLIFFCYSKPPPNPNDPDYATYIFEESDGWTTVEEDEDDKPKVKVPEQVPGEPPVEMSPEELEFIRKNAEFDEYGYPFEYKYVDKEHDDKLLADFDARIAAANDAILAEAAAKKLPYWRKFILNVYNY